MSCRTVFEAFDPNHCKGRDLDGVALCDAEVVVLLVHGLAGDTVELLAHPSGGRDRSIAMVVSRTGIKPRTLSWPCCSDTVLFFGQ